MEEGTTTLLNVLDGQECKLDTKYGLKEKGVQKASSGLQRVYFRRVTHMHGRELWAWYGGHHAARRDMDRRWAKITRILVVGISPLACGMGVTRLLARSLDGYGTYLLCRAGIPALALSHLTADDTVYQVRFLVKARCRV
ncbi:hypothetical protein HAX54_040972 [Datura stramonium]|uniref:Uncharacterized protein n=1 Tax=Datura stramonium TaxID=4076 RepID=A0ABS8VNB7_DATST|nr:hypothetical protein [Datura stramonium]